MKKLTFPERFDYLEEIKKEIDTEIIKDLKSKQLKENSKNGSENDRS